MEIFHKEVKSQLGFEDVSCSDFSSVSAHVHWVYVSYLLVRLLTNKTSVGDSQKVIAKWLDAEPFKKIKKVVCQFDGKDAVKSLCHQVIEEARAA